MNWLKRLVCKWVREERDSPEENQISIPRIRSMSKSATIEVGEFDNPVRFELSSAVGGRILTVRRYDPRTDRSDNQVYVIPQGEDVGARVSKILNLELLK